MDISNDNLLPQRGVVDCIVYDYVAPYSFWSIEMVVGIWLTFNLSPVIGVVLFMCGFMCTFATLYEGGAYVRE